MSDQVETHPIQWQRKITAMPKTVTLRAYEVYAHVHGEQKALIEGWCRGGFSIGELTAFLYARSFPQHEWSQRVDEAFNGMKQE